MPTNVGIACLTRRCRRRAGGAVDHRAELAKHIEYAQTTKNLPGKHGTTRYLTRLTDKDKKKQNPSKACPATLERPEGKSCDEYPFATTWQGASTGGGDSAAA